LTFSI